MLNGRKVAGILVATVRRHGGGGHRHQRESRGLSRRAGRGSHLAAAWPRARALPRRLAGRTADGGRPLRPMLAEAGSRPHSRHVRAPLQLRTGKRVRVDRPEGAITGVTAGLDRTAVPARAPRRRRRNSDPGRRGPCYLALDAGNTNITIGVFDGAPPGWPTGGCAPSTNRPPTSGASCCATCSRWPSSISPLWTASSSPAWCRRSIPRWTPWRSATSAPSRCSSLRTPTPG